MKFLIAALSILLFGATSSAALFEVRLAYGLHTSDPSLGDLCDACTDLPSINPNYGLGYEVIVMPPLFPVGLGMRYENLGLSLDSGTFEYESKITRTALIINSRIIDTLMYIGPIFTYGLSHSGEFEIGDSSLPYSAKYTSSKASSYSIGLEAGIRLGFLLGAEIGYQSMTFQDAENSNNESEDIKLAGNYAKVMLGFGF